MVDWVKQRQLSFFRNSNLRVEQEELLQQNGYYAKLIQSQLASGEIKAV